MNGSIKNDRGFVIITCLAILLMLGIIGAVAVMKSADDVEISGTQLRDVNALYAAEAGAEYAYALFRNALDSTSAPPDPLPSGTFTLEGYNVEYAVALTDSAMPTTLNKGTYQGLFGISNRYEILGTATSTSTPINSTVALRTEKVLVPLFQFAVFYEEDLEIHPGPAMTLSGRVHTNRNMYASAGSGLDIESFTTAAGSIHHGHKAGAGGIPGGGSVRIKDGGGNWKDMKNDDGTWLDHDSPVWVDSSLARWQGQVQDQDHGINDLYLPVAVSGDPVDMIKDASGSNPDSYEHQAGLKIIDGQAYFRQADNSWTNVTGALIADGSIAGAAFYDGREGKNITALEIDISNLNNSAYWPSNGIIYTKQSVGGADLPATRLVNGSELKAGLTVVSENPIYTKGDYNSVNKKPAAIVGDAYSILSNDWVDAQSVLDLSQRVAANTQVNASFITGNTTTGEDGQNYNGGLENLPRFLENWAGKTLTFRGSMVDLWESEQATGMWSYGAYYTAPIRDWGFDMDLLDPSKLPPGTPMVNLVVKRQWAQLESPEE